MPAGEEAAEVGGGETEGGVEELHGAIVASHVNISLLAS
jgi:hypothetical protein